MNTITSKIRIAFLTPQDPLNRRSWSGTLSFMAGALGKHCGEVVFLGPAPFAQFGGKAINRITRAFLNKRYDYSHSISYARKCASFFESKLAGSGCDLIFAPAAATGIAYLNTSIPIVYVSDTTFALLHGYYPEFTNLLKKSINDGNAIERSAIGKAETIVYSSEWAARSAARDYGAAPDKIRVIPFGANLEMAPPRDAVVNRKKSNKCRLLFLAVNWTRKGGSLAFDTLQNLKNRGVDAELIVCGCVPPARISSERMTVIPYLDKNNAPDRKRLTELLLSADFLLLPTRHDCTPVVFCEANAFGLPVITCDTGGVSAVIRNGENGFMLPSKAGGADYAEMIAAVYRDDRRYSELRLSCRAAFEERLNWGSWAKAVNTVFVHILKGKQRQGDDRSTTRKQHHESSFSIEKNSVHRSGRRHDPDDQDQGISCPSRHHGGHLHGAGA
ncbi:MAG: hypothetical protein A2010_10675 [Nitrospirae bacterium GWD2_57_9]|nr:MAG: hypothetical protein A2010_10675 [Nitrospirae bacterium GWD2_57_9]OGW47988.1 MAG: hypothetical protein A2078_08985 [Nitrospirae bacterium GWC2_57_9]